MIAIIDYGVGNLRSIHNMLERAGIPSVISGQPDILRRAAKLILPGVGHFRFGMEQLRARRLVEVLNERVLHAKTPILGICLGTQLMGRMSEEGNAEGLGWLPMDTVAFDRTRMQGRAKIPHMGWSETAHAGHALFDGQGEMARFYYVHSFHLRVDHGEMVISTAENGYRFASGVASGNILGVQFHPEKSHAYGLKLLKSFASMTIRA